MHELIPLKAYRWSRRKSRLELHGSTVSIVLPSYFGNQQWNVPVADLAVSDLTLLPDEPSTQEPEEVFFEQPIALPYFFTTGPATEPTLALLVRKPVKTPVLRRVVAMAPNVDLPFTRRESRSTKGALVDGVLLRAERPSEAVRLLGDAGAEVTLDPEGWLRAHRQLASRHERVAQLKRHDTVLRRLERGQTAALVMALPLLVASDRFARPWDAVGYAVATTSLALSLALPQVARWLARRFDSR